MKLKNNILKILKKCFRTKWTIGFVEVQLVDAINPEYNLNVHWLQHDFRGRWFADPFVLEVNDTDIILLVEEYYDPIHRGRISRMIVDRKSYKIKSLNAVLTLPTHLSFPAIKRINGRFLIYPESGASGELTLYDYNVKTNICQPLMNICDGPLADAILTDVFGEQMIFATEVPQHNGDTLNVYKENPDGKYYKSNQIKFDGMVARNAGDWFKIGDSVYRPAQDCNKTYGGAVIIQKVVAKGDEFVFTDIRRISSSNMLYNEGCHTFNYYKGILVLDAKGYRFPGFVKIWRKISTLKKMLKR